MNLDPNATTETGAHGKAELIPIPDHPGAAQTTTWWLLTAPAFHPLWSQYCICVVRLDDNVAGFPPPKRQFDGATHEFIVMALEPGTAAHTVESMQAGPLRWLEPINIVEQFTATDDEMRELAHLAAWGVVHWALSPEVSDAPARIRETWLASLVRTLAHIRGEEHTAGGAQ